MVHGVIISNIRSIDLFIFPCSMCKDCKDAWDNLSANFDMKNVINILQFEQE